MYSYVIEVADSESAFGFYNKGLVSEIRVLDFLRMIRVPFTFETSITVHNNLYILKTIFTLLLYLIEFTLTRQFQPCGGVL